MSNLSIEVVIDGEELRTIRIKVYIDIRNFAV